jgi:hypothetical protein
MQINIYEKENTLGREKAGTPGGVPMDNFAIHLSGKVQGGGFCDEDIHVMAIWRIKPFAEHEQ